MKRDLVVEFSVKVHTCRLLQDYGPGTLESNLVPNNRYICVRNPRHDEDEEPTTAVTPSGKIVPIGLEKPSKEPEFYQMRTGCKCRKWITFREAIDLCDSGHALWAYKVKNGEVERCEPDPPRRNHMGAPIRGALGCIWRPVVVGKVPRIDLITKADIERSYVNLVGASIKKIETIHTMHVEMLRALIVPFEPDPQEGRCLFPFTADERTSGGHSD